MRLIGGPTLGEGRLEIFHNGEWGTVCDNRFNANEDGKVVCAQLGYGTAKSTGHSRSGNYGVGTGRAWKEAGDSLTAATNALGRGATSKPHEPLDAAEPRFLGHASASRRQRTWPMVRGPDLRG